MFPNTRIFPVKLFSYKTLTSFVCTLSMTILCLIFQMQNASAAQITLQWDDNNQSGLVAGYYAYCGTSSGNYTVTKDVKSQTSCIFPNLEEGQVYYFAVRAYSSTGVSSSYSDELVYLVPITIDTLTDADGDGISDYDEINTYHTDPQRADTDNDGLADGEELAFWGSNWNRDDDNDGIINLLDNDSDNDGYSDGLEINSGSDPSTKGSIPSVPSDTGAVAFWKFDEGSGNLAADASGGGYTGTLVNSPAWVSHTTGDPALHFDGAASYVDTGLDQHLSNWTVSTWVKGDKAPGSTKDAGPIMREENYMITWDHKGAAFRGAATVCVKGGWYAASFGTLDPNVWYYLTATYHGETLRAFKDGKLITENANPSGPPMTRHIPQRSDGMRCGTNILRARLIM